MKKELFVLAGTAMMLFQACQDTSVVTTIERESNEIQFANYVGGMTRASRGTGATFVAGDQMEVYGYQTTSENDLAVLFNKQLVRNTGEAIWTYDYLKYWEKNSTYDFYAIFPYSDANSFDATNRLFSVTDFTVKDTASQQVDLMIAQRIVGRQSYDVVNFVFNHVLSNVNFNIKTASEFNTNGIAKVVVKSFDVTGLYSKGSFAQTGWSSNVFNGTWTPDVTSVYDLPKVENVNYTIGNPNPEDLASDLLLLPQQINDNAQIKISFKLVYSDGTETNFNREIALNQIVGKKRSNNAQVTLSKWEPNYRYFYTIAINPAVNQQGGHFQPTAIDSLDQADYADPDTQKEPKVNIIKIDNDGDGVPDEYWIDSDLDDDPDYPIIWIDIDDDGKLEGLPDRNNDGIPDDTDKDGKPDVIWYDSDGDNIVDKELERDPDVVEVPDGSETDYDGGVDGYKNAKAWIVNDGNNHYIDLDNDGEGDIPILWKDIDGDGKLEGIADKNKDGCLNEEDTYDGDGVDYNGNPNAYDVILFLSPDENNNLVWNELEKEVDEPDNPERPNVIQFSAEVSEWTDDYDANYNLQ